MPSKKNPLKLNALQLKTLTILQQLGRTPLAGVLDEETGEVTIHRLPDPHGDHFHCGDAVVMSADATGLKNEAVWKALERKGLVRSMYPQSVAISQAGQKYETGLADKILQRSDH